MRGSKKDAILQVRMTKDLKDQLQKVAAEYGVTMTTVVIYAIVQFIRANEFGR